MRLSLDTAFLVLAFANTLVEPVNAAPSQAPKRHLLKHATDGFHKTALRHSARLAKDLRIALRGLGVASPMPVSVPNSGSAAFCVPKGSNPKSNTNTTAPSVAHTLSPVATTSTSKGASSVTSTSTPSPTVQSNWALAQSYVRLNFDFGALPARQIF